MKQLAVGDRVMAIDGSHEGRLVDVDGPTGYVLQPNGVEVAFPLLRLKPWAPAPVAEVRTLQGANRDRVLSAAETALLGSVPAPLLAAVARSYDAGGDAAAGRVPFAALPPSKRLDAIRIHLPTLPPSVLGPHMALVLRVRALPRPGR